MPAALVFTLWFWPRYIGGERVFRPRPFIWPLLICLALGGIGLYVGVQQGLIENPLQQLQDGKARRNGTADRAADMPTPAAARAAVLAADRAFSARAAEVGINRAFREFADDSAVLLRPNARPIVGTAAIAAATSKPDSTFTLTWAPQRAIVAASGDLAYTYGTYRLQPRPAGAPATSGTYVTIWRRDARTHHWRYVLDAGAEGLGNQ